MDPNASTAANQPRMETATDAPAGDRATGLPPGAPIPPASGASGRPTSGSRQPSGPPRTKLALRALVVSGVMVAAMTWVIVPVMTRLFGGWLARSPHPRPRHHGGPGRAQPDRPEVVVVRRGTAAIPAPSKSAFIWRRHRYRVS
jgi:hypothetical protein